MARGVGGVMMEVAVKIMTGVADQGGVVGAVVDSGRIICGCDFGIGGGGGRGR